MRPLSREFVHVVPASQSFAQLHAAGAAKGNLKL
jgi:hypothetical protein